MSLDEIPNWVEEDFLALKIIVIKAKSRNPVLLRQLRLLFDDFPRSEIVKTELSGNARLVVAGEKGFCLDHVVPFGKAHAVGPVILGDGMKLGEIESKGPWILIVR